MRPRLGSKLFRRLEAVFGLVPTFLARLDDAGAVLDEGEGSGGGLHGEADPRGARPPEGDVVCRQGPPTLRRPVGGDPSR